MYRVLSSLWLSLLAGQLAVLAGRIKRMKYVAGGGMRMFMRKIGRQHIAALDWQGMHNNAGVMAYNRILERTWRTHGVERLASTRRTHSR